MPFERDWGCAHSSGITASVIGALQRGLTPLSKELGFMYVAGAASARGKRLPN
jgi:hypothetical protein